MDYSEFPQYHPVALTYMGAIYRLDGVIVPMLIYYNKFYQFSIQINSKKFYFNVVGVSF